MEISSVGNLTKRLKADLLVIPCWQGSKRAEFALSLGSLEKLATAPITAHDFHGKEGELSILYPPGQKEKRFLLLGLGKKKEVTQERLRRAYASMVRYCLGQQMIQHLNLLLPKGEELRGVAEGLFLANYSYDEWKKAKRTKSDTTLLKKVTLVAGTKTALATFKKAKTLCEGVALSRDLVNGNADDVNTPFFVKLARTLSRKYSKIKTTIFDKKRLEKEGMGLFLAVSRAARVDPALIIMEYRGAPKSKEKTAVIGKGLTYDSGGLSLKPGNSMLTMKCDMGGAATVFGMMQAIASLGLKVNVTGVVAATENSIGSESYKLGDVFDSYLGKSVEVQNTDAEGRLALADALAYVEKKLKPTRMVDFATLTGAVEIALGSEVTGMMSNDDALAEKFKVAGEKTFERVWPLPLYEEYRQQLKSDIADLRNIGGRPGSSITAGMFLKEFVEKTPWVHFDIAATAFLSKPRRYHPKLGTGIGVRLMVEFLESL